MISSTKKAEILTKFPLPTFVSAFMYFFIQGCQSTSELSKLNGIVHFPTAQGQNWLLMYPINLEA